MVSRYDALSERIREDLRVYGSEARMAPSVHRLQALYLDFGRAALAEDLAESVLRALEGASLLRVLPEGVEPADLRRRTGAERERAG